MLYLLQVITLDSY